MWSVSNTRGRIQCGAAMYLWVFGYDVENCTREDSMWSISCREYTVEHFAFVDTIKSISLRHTM